MGRWRTALLGLGVILSGAPGAVALDNAGRPFLADDIERRHNGRFLFTTGGDGTFAMFQRVDDPSGILAGREVVCMMNVCYVAIDAVSHTALDGAGRDPDHTEGVRQSFKAARDAYESTRRAPAAEKAGAEQIWRDRAARIGPCIRDRSACRSEP